LPEKAHEAFGGLALFETVAAKFSSNPTIQVQEAIPTMSQPVGCGFVTGGNLRAENLRSGAMKKDFVAQRGFAANRVAFPVECFR
jgi:hypothetical protein